MPKIDRSVDGMVQKAAMMSFIGLGQAEHDGQPNVIIYLKTKEVAFPVSISRSCASGLLECLLELKKLSPRHFKE